VEAIMKLKIIWASCLASIILIIILSPSLLGQEEPKVSELGGYRITTNIPNDYDLLPNFYKEHQREERLRRARGEFIDSTKPACLPQCHTFEQIGEIRPTPKVAETEIKAAKLTKNPVESVLISLMMLGYFFAPLY
jgi:hypothetical protein